MEETKPDDKRRLPRYLCSELFSDTVMHFMGDIHVMVSVNFNHKGIALYSPNRLQEQSECYLSFQYNLDNRLIVLNQIPAIIRYRFETEVGHQYGIQFNIEQFRDLDLDKLKQIEHDLASHQSIEDRWQS